MACGRFALGLFASRCCFALLLRVVALCYLLCVICAAMRQVGVGRQKYIISVGHARAEMPCFVGMAGKGPSIGVDAELNTRSDIKRSVMGWLHQLPRSNLLSKAHSSMRYMLRNGHHCSSPVIAINLNLSLSSLSSLLPLPRRSFCRLYRLGGGVLID